MPSLEKFHPVKGLQIYDLAYQYLLERDGITTRIIDKHLNLWQQGRPNDLSDLYYKLAHHAQNKQGMPNSIGDIDNLRPLLFEFDACAVVEHYPNWEAIFDVIVASDYTPPGRMVRDNKRSYWVLYCKSLLSTAQFVTTFESVAAFTKFVETFYINELSRLALPLLLEKELFGFGFPLACDFLKEAGYPQFIKPDVHIIELAIGLGISISRDPFQVFKDVVKYSEAIGRLPYEVDKLFWLVGSGSFYLDNISVSTSREEFITLAKHSVGI